MSAKSSTTTSTTQRPVLVPVSFGPDYTDLFGVKAGGDIDLALSVAADLSDGVSQLCGRLDDCINGGEIAYCSEIRTLGFISDAVAALVRSAKRGLDVVAEAEAAQ